MTPKEYFYLNFKNAITETKVDFINPFPRDILSDQNISEALRTDLPNSNDYGFNLMIERLKEKSAYNINDTIYVGKLGNPMPNCYTVNSDEIDGCLICYTTGMSENVNLFSQAIITILTESPEIRKEVMTLYTSFLLLELERRIHNWYGKQIPTNIFLDIGMGLLIRDNIDKILATSGSYSSLMDMILILHEYAHHVMRSLKISTNPGLKVLAIRTMELYDDLCNKLPEMADLPSSEIQADLMALLLFTNGVDPECIDIICIFTAFLQLNGMSADDIYTNKHRLTVVEYFFQNSPNYQQDKDTIFYCLSVFSSVFENARADPYDTTTNQLGLVGALKSIYDVSSLPETRKKAIAILYAEFVIKQLKENLEKEIGQSIDPSIFENF